MCMIRKRHSTCPWGHVIEVCIRTSYRGLSPSCISNDLSVRDVRNFTSQTSCINWSKVDAMCLTRPSFYRNKMASWRTTIVNSELWSFIEQRQTWNTNLSDLIVSVNGIYVCSPHYNASPPGHMCEAWNPYPLPFCYSLENTYRVIIPRKTANSNLLFKTTAPLR